MFNLLPWRWTHWVLLLVGPLFVVTYLTLLEWGPIDDAVQRLAIEPALRDLAIVRAETLFGLVTLILLTPLAAMVALFLLLFAMVILAVAAGPVIRLLGLPESVFVLLLGAAFSALIYANSQAWMPWSLWFFDRVTSVYLILVL